MQPRYEYFASARFPPKNYVDTKVSTFVLCSPLELVMRARKIVRWGNSMAVRLPKVVLRDAGLQEGDTLVLGAKNGAIVAKPVRKKPVLKDLLSRISPENIHEEVDWGKPRGREAW